MNQKSCPRCKTTPCQCSDMPHINEMPTFPDNDGTAGHSKENWRISGEMTIDGYDNICSIARGTLQSVSSANQRLITLAQSAPHDCGDPECSGVINAQSLKTYEYLHTMLRELAPDFETIAQCIDFAGTNKRKVELYDKFQCAIKAFAEQGLLT